MIKEFWEYEETGRLGYDNCDNTGQDWTVLENMKYYTVDEILKDFLSYGKITIRAREGFIQIIQED